MAAKSGQVAFLTKRWVLLYHKKVIDVHGGLHGVRDDAGLESALAQPKATFGGAYLHEGVREMAAAYAHGLVKNHAFLDGNKRIAAVAMVAFLDANGVALHVDEVELQRVIQALAASELDRDGLIHWLWDAAP